MSLKKDISEKEIFSAIGSLEKKYQKNESYQRAIGGLMCNLGADIKSKNLINAAIKKIKQKLQEKEYNELLFNLGNCFHALAEIELSEAGLTLKALIETSTFNDAIAYYSKAKPDNIYSYEKSITNAANILNRHGRNLEAIYLFDKALKRNPRFGMASGNKAIAIHHYISLTHKELGNHVSLPLISTAIELLIKALQDDKLQEIGGINAEIAFKGYLQKLSSVFERPNLENHSEKHNKLSNYQKFCLKKNIFLNYDFGYYYDKQSTVDNFFPKFIEELSEKRSRNDLMSEKTYYSFHVWNQIIEAFTSSRKHYFDILNQNHTHTDKQVIYAYTFDYSRHGIKYGSLKSIFCNLYNCLDKIGRLTYFYFSDTIDNYENKFHFSELSEDGFKDIITKTNNIQLVALRSLSLDFTTGHQYSYLREIRNRITHSFLNVRDDLISTSNLADFEIVLKKLYCSIEEMFLIVKAAIMYSVIAINSTKKNDKTISLIATLEKDIFRGV